MSMIKYGFGSIEAAATDIQSTSGRINSLLEGLKGQIRPMVNTWEGESATAYQAAQQQWDKAAAELNTILATIAQTVRAGNDRMSDINRRAAASWG
ncbi:WXG100 family type VII secretion target [Corynebacterium sp. 153RC1]|uniref:WXG100 family type VII secretion target n=1 Tax=Corynebacterium TaxID=1716 RepID=UPI00211CCA8A|nr:MULTISPECIES: WXG100 family type VII secretion target [unclassified Corynebacterium]MCQ9371613.1 WXG100 family type VII secretion target [Corynebacterium sp. 35RC1]MCQ9342549.1 WXG100 family type VII secretion target [Corynebacterium sp. 76QC2CO]MCQ9352227.1 WXG100 family type VII secretion target [Corynebacterium sp. 209RC1]MCQ9354230.1 WXG100 family type VII secretion target [Corynebacterium sp. 1222RC1]MCQ9356510.1 WXG100 family type VII secretion target [Corynebacterium sp. 122RC1]